jgi:hypothetical protein
MADQPDRRASDRMPVNAGTSCTFVSPVVEDFGAAKIRDITLDGVGLILSRKVEAGSMLAVSLANPTHAFAKTVVVRVAHVTAVPGGFLVGGNFTPPLTYQELTSLVM